MKDRVWYWVRGDVKSRKFCMGVRCGACAKRRWGCCGLEEQRVLLESQTGRDLITGNRCWVKGNTGSVG